MSRAQLFLSRTTASYSGFLPEQGLGQGLGWRKPLWGGDPGSQPERMRKTSLGGEESQHRLCQGWVTAVGKWGSTLEEPQSTSLSRVAGKGRGAFSHQVGASLAGVASGVCTRLPCASAPGLSGPPLLLRKPRSRKAEVWAWGGAGGDRHDAVQQQRRNQPGRRLREGNPKCPSHARC